MTASCFDCEKKELLKSKPAAGLTRQKAKSVLAMRSHRSSTSAKAKPPRCHAKNRQLHSALATSWTTNKLRATDRDLLG